MNFFKKFSIKNSLLIFFQIILFSLLQSCSGSQFGQRLTNSFDTPLEEVASSSEIKVKSIKKVLPEKEINKSIKKDISISRNNLSSNLVIRNKSDRSTKGSKPFKLIPYRIIIKLYGEDPSAPAQIVTSALRNAGVEFEVERIEKFDIDNKLKNSSIK